jgi:transcriptional regulator with XRE-family HTH domain
LPARERGRRHEVCVHDGEMQIRLRTLGETLRTLRIERDYSIGEVALGTGLSSSFLSLVENGRSDISTGRLFRVARFLGVGLADLLKMDPLREVTIVRADERLAVEMPAEGLRMFPLVNDHDDLAMAPVVSELEVGAHLRDLPDTEGVEHFVFVIRGEVEIVLTRTEPLLLGAGDCAYFGSQSAREVRNAGAERAVILWVSSPPATGVPLSR